MDQAKEDLQPLLVDNECQDARSLTALQPKLRKRSIPLVGLLIISAVLIIALLSLTSTSFKENIQALNDVPFQDTNFLLISALNEGNARANTHLAQAATIAQFLNRTLVFPNIDNGRLLVCASTPFDLYYKSVLSSALLGRGQLTPRSVPHG